MKITDLQPDPRNANRGTERGRQALEHSLRTYGAGRSILVDKHGKVIAGNKTLQTAVDIGLEDIEVIQTDGTKVVAVQRMDLDLMRDKAARELAYADNRVAELDLDFDPETLLTDLQQGVDLEAFWTKQELDQMLQDLTPKIEDPGAETDRAAELQEKWQTERGQIWQIGRHRLMCGDSTDEGDVGALLAGEAIDLLLTDPPYGIDYQKDGASGTHGWKNYGKVKWDSKRPSAEAFDVMRGLAKEQVIWGGNYFADLLPPTMRWLVWDKGQRDFSLADCELAWTSEQKASRVFTYSRAAALQDGKEHPTQKPVALMGWCIEQAGQSQTILDLYLGSGTTMVAAEQNDRTCYGMEIDPGYCAVILERMSTMQLDCNKT